MPEGCVCTADANAVLSKSTWAVLALTCHIELFTQEHYRESIEPDASWSGAASTPACRSPSATPRSRTGWRWSVRSTASCRRNR